MLGGGTEKMRARGERPKVTLRVDRADHSFEGNERERLLISRASEAPADSKAIINLAHAALDILAVDVTTRRHNPPKVTDHCVNAFCTLLMSGGMKPALNFTRMFVRRGADYETVAEDLFTAAARRMGCRWVRDNASTVDVNIGCSTLTRTHVAFRSMLKEPAPALEASAIFGSFTGQAHILGLSFAAEHFRRRGWNVRHMPGTQQGAFLAAVASQMPDIVGLTAATDSDLKLLQQVIAQLRKLHATPRIIVGGSSPNLDCLGADAVVSRLDMGLVAAHRLVR